MPTDGLTFQAWPGPDDCWASVYEPPSDAYPFDVVQAIVATGPSASTESFLLEVWDVGNENVPSARIDGAIVDVPGNELAEIDLVANGIDSSLIMEGRFALVMCHVDHMGEPSIATDDDGNVDAGLNWVKAEGSDEWQTAAGFANIDGDFILRAVIQTY